MPIRKRKTTSGFTWAYYFDLPGSTRQDRRTVSASGFETKKEAQDAERERFTEEQDKLAAAAKGISVIPKTLREMLEEFCSQHADKTLAPKTAERYREQMAYLATGLMEMPIPEITPLHLTREWSRLRESGGHHRKTKLARALSSKTVRNIAGFVSSAFAWAISQGVATLNPATESAKPRGGETRKAVAFSPAEHRLMVEASSHWVAPTLLEVCAGLGARRGEVLALRWSDIQGDEATIGRSLTQTKSTLEFKEPKTRAGYRTVTVPGSTLAVLEQHRARQIEFRRQFGADYRADLDLIFANPDGTPLKPDSISSTISNLCRKLKMPKGSSLHAERHSHGSQLIAGGMELPAVSARLGHSSTHVTAKVYAHMLQGRDRAAAEVWDAMQNPATARRHHAGESGQEIDQGKESSGTENERIRPN